MWKETQVKENKLKTTHLFSFTKCNLYGVHFCAFILQEILSIKSLVQFKLSTVAFESRKPAHTKTDVRVAKGEKRTHSKIISSIQTCYNG